MRSHTVTVTFDDEVTSLDAIISALGEAGYTVPRLEKRASP
jgi:copper chaperone CopZ